MSDIQRIEEGMAQLAASLKADAVGQITAAISELESGIATVVGLVGTDHGLAGALEATKDALEEALIELNGTADEIQGWRAFG